MASGPSLRRRVIIDGLRHNARPVDRVDRGQRVAGAEFSLAEQRLHDALRVVERPFDGDGVDVVLLSGGHLLALPVAQFARAGTE